MDDQVIARVRQVINDSKLSQRLFAESIGLDESKLTKSLRGTRKLSSLELSLVAEIGNTTMEWLLTGASPRSWAFAQRSGLLDRDLVDEAGRLAISMIAERFEAAEALGFAPESVDLPIPAHLSRYVDEANSLATTALQRIPARLSDLETSQLIREVETAFAVNVVVTSLPDGCDGLSYEDGPFRIIVLARTDRAARQRNTLGHELGHLLWGDARQNVLEENLSAASKTHAESRANVFAAAFLMPRDEVLELLAGNDPSELFATLVWRFQVSPESMAWRLFNLNLINNEQRLLLARQTTGAVASQLGTFDAQVRRSQDANFTRPPRRLADAYIGAYASGEIAAGPVASLLGWTVDDVRAFFDEIDTESVWMDNPEAEA